MIYSVYGPPPPQPRHYPVSINLVNACGGLVKHRLANEDQYFALRFWHWHAAPMGHSQCSPRRKDLDRGDLVKEQSNQALG